MVKYIDQLDLRNQRVFIRVDFNVPISDGEVGDSTRLEAVLPTLRYALDQNAKVILASHLGRPKGQRNPALSLAPVGSKLSDCLGIPVSMALDCVGPAVESEVAKLTPREVLLLENLRFHPDEEKNDEAFARSLASLADVYINDAFGTAHRAHASTVGMVPFVADHGAGFLLKKECEYLSSLMTEPRRPLMAILGGAKVSDKIQLIRSLLERVDILLIGGAMAYTFLRAQGKQTGTSIVEEEYIELARELLVEADKRKVSLLLPTDHVVAQEARPGAMPVPVGEIPSDKMGLDIGTKTLQRFCGEVSKAGTVFWNGPMGLFEIEPFDRGTMELALSLAESKAVTVVGGGDTVAAIKRLGRETDFSHISTGGGATLEYLEGKNLPGLAALEDE